MTDISQHLTPQWVIDQGYTLITRPAIINPYDHPTYNEMIRDKELIRHLQLVPVKNFDDQRAYHALDRQKLVDEIQDLINDCTSCTLILPNKYPYALPPETDQYIIWVQDWGVTNRAIIHDLTAKLREIDLNRCIFFERPVNTTAKMIRGTIPQIRHIHFWCEKGVYNKS